ncbi:MAG TPA: penicillin acylase family protein, partial [Candidatus Kapabacteria bacterium]|nr:penicillin acylase family protein [Candidatus Kapabacteria bacterium]
MQFKFKIFTWLLSILFVVITILFFIFKIAFLSLPKSEIEFESSAFKDEVSVYKNQYSIPHIISKNEADAYFMLGFLHAQDRLWQMETLRRKANGTLSEVLGKEY